MTRTTPSRRRRLVVAGALAAAVAAVPAAASAQTAPPGTGPARVAFLRARGDFEINRRLSTLSADAERLTDAQRKLDAALAAIGRRFSGDTNVATLKTKVDGDLQSLASLVSADQTGLTALKNKIDTQDTTFQEIVPDVQSIVTAYRIYVLVDPKIHLTVASDRELVVGELLTDVGQLLQQRINSAPPTTPGLADAKARLADLQSKVPAAVSLATPVAGQVGPLQPSGYPANKATLQSALTAVQTAHGDLKEARADVDAIRDDLR